MIKSDIKYVCNRKTNGWRIHIIMKNTSVRKRKKEKIIQQRMYPFGYQYFLSWSILDLARTYFGYKRIVI